MTKNVLRFSFCIMITLFMIPSVILSASFDCSRASLSKTEKTICSEPALSKLDDELATEYAKALKVDDPDAVRTVQRKWLRNTLYPCREDKNCIKIAYENRLRQLASVSDSVKTLAHDESLLPQADKLVAKSKESKCPQCGSWQLDYSAPAGLVGEIIDINDRDITLPACGTFKYKVQKTEIEEIESTPPGEYRYNYKRDLILTQQTASLLCPDEKTGTWKMEFKIEGDFQGGSTMQCILRRAKANKTTLFLSGWNMDGQSPCDPGGGRDMATCFGIENAWAYKVLSSVAESAYRLLLDTKPNKLPSFNPARFSATISRFCEKKEQDTGGGSWPVAWSYLCQNFILSAKLQEFFAWEACMEKRKNGAALCKFPTEGFDRSVKVEIE